MAVNPTDGGAPAPPRPIARLLGLARPHRWALVWAALLMLAGSLAALTIPWLTGDLAERLIGGEQLRRLLGLIALAIVVDQIFRTAAQMQIWRTSDRITAALRRRLFDHLLHLPLDWYDRHRPGDVLSMVATDCERIGGFLTTTLPALAPSLLTLSGALIVIFVIHPPAATAIVLAMPLFFVLTRLWTRHARRLSQESYDAHAETVAVAEESLAMLPLIKAYRREGAQHHAFSERVAALIALRDRLRRILSPIAGIVQVLASLGLITLVWFLSGDLGGNGLRIGQLVALLMYGVLIARPLASLSGAWGAFQQARGALARLDVAMTATPEPAADEGRPLPDLRGHIRLEGVGFSYPNGTRVFENLSLDIGAGERVAIVGANGSGKSTLVRLLLAFSQPQAGRVLLDGEDLAGLRLADLRRQIALVPQTVWIMDASLRDNIAFGRDIDDERVRRAAALAGAWSFIDALPDGLDSLAGPRGVRLSGGQQQRLALARALASDCRLLILDEATAMFDPAGEADFVGRASDALQGRTVLFITHRPAVLDIADRIIELPAGREVASS